MQRAVSDQLFSRVNLDKLGLLYRNALRDPSGWLKVNLSVLVIWLCDFYGLYYTDPVDFMLPFLSENRESMVLKVNQAYGGFGITTGREVSRADWEAALEEALKGDYAVQEFVSIPIESFPIFHERGYQGFEPRNVNINYWCHDGQFAGAFLRASKGSLINVHQAGGWSRCSLWRTIDR